MEENNRNDRNQKMIIKKYTKFNYYSDYSLCGGDVDS